MYKTVLVGDFETTVYDGQESTEVWASALVELGSEDVHIFHSLPDTYVYLTELHKNLILYYHNLKFDGPFWMDYLINTLHMKQAIDENHAFIDTKHMENNTFKYLISDMGQWYSITIKTKGYIIEIRDSLKLLPFSVAEIGKGFQTKHQKLNMEYRGYRYAGCPITADEKKYIGNDVLVIKEALEIMFAEGHNRLTIGSCCLAEFRNILGKYTYDRIFVDMPSIQIDKNKYGCDNADAYVRKSYHGGWCYLVQEKANKVYRQGVTADVNSLYPSQMSASSGNIYPTGKPHFWSGDFPKIWNGHERQSLKEYAKDKNNHTYYFVRFRSRFKLKNGFLPTVQIKGSPWYSPTEWLDSSDIFDKKTKQYYRWYTDLDGNRKEAKPVLTMTMTDFELFNDHYNLFDVEILDGCYFEADEAEYIFEEYIDKYRRIKMESKGAKRTLAKLFLNSLYGKTASSTHSDYKIAIEDDDDFSYHTIFADEKKAGYIPIGSAITSYARNFTIRTAQKNYHGANKRGFIYADTDSIHCDLQPDELIGVPVHANAFNHWKIEATWDEAIFVRQKTYIEHIVEEDLEPIDDPYYSVKCAGMPKKAKDLFVCSMTGEDPDFEPNERQKEFLKVKRTLNDFQIGLMIPDGKLMPVRIKGGIVLKDSDFEMRQNLWRI